MSVLVVGMHRSGTSVATRVVSLLGVPVCRPADLLRVHGGNERGHWESTPLALENERLLHAVSARWWCPPDNAREVAALADDGAVADRARRVFETSHPTPHWVWKDPRLCLLLPFWARVLPRPPVALIVYRNPVEVAASLRARNDVALPFGVALWERYVQLSLEGTRTMPTLVSSYHDLMTDPVGWAGRVSRFLTAEGIEARVPPVTAGIRAFVTDGLQHMASPHHHAGLLTETQRDYVEYLRALAADETTREATAAPAADPRTAEMMRQVAATAGLHVPGADAAGSAAARPPGVRVRVREAARPAPKPTAPRVSVLLQPNGHAAGAVDVERLESRLPPDAEIITVITPDDAADPRDGDAPALLRVRRDRPMSLAQRLNTAAELARADLLVILAGMPVRPRPGWLPALRNALAADDECGAVGPVLCAPGAGLTAYGLRSDRWFVDVDWHPADEARADPVSVWSLSATALVTTRRHLDAVGGFDDGLTGSGREDLDLCLRLWRGGWTCLAVPDAVVDVDAVTPDAGEVDLLTNLLRLGMVHLDRDRLREQLDLVSGCAGFPAALARVTAGDVGSRRSVVGALSWYRTTDLGRLSQCPAPAAAT